VQNSESAGGLVVCLAGWRQSYGYSPCFGIVGLLCSQLAQGITDTDQAEYASLPANAVGDGPEAGECGIEFLLDQHPFLDVVNPT
jgi:hypothetical protein